MSLERLRILVVEDHYDTCHILEFILADMGHWVEGVHDTSTALERLQQDGFDVLLTDIWLPDARGWNLIHELKARGQLPRYVVSMSTLHVDEVRGPSQAAGCYAHLVKPFKVSELEQILEGINAECN